MKTRAKAKKAGTAKRKITTIGDILAKDDVQGILGALEKHKAEIKDIVVIIVDEKDFIRYLCSVSPAEMVYLMEHAKLMSLNDDTVREG